MNNDIALTRQQEKTLEWLKREILANDGLQSVSNAYEYKQFEVKPVHRQVVCLITEVGRKNDEGTAAQLFGRTRRQIFIGPRGGCKLVNAVSDNGKLLRTYPTGRAVTYARTL